MKITEGFKEQVQEAWGDPHYVAEMATDELVKHIKGAGLDLGDQDDHVLRVLTLAGETKNKDPAIFIKRFEEEVLASLGG